MKKSLIVIAVLSTISNTVFAENFGTSTATGANAIAWGDRNRASGHSSTAGGVRSIASGSTSIALGNFTKSTGAASVALGNSTESKGLNSTATGLGTLSQASSEFVTGTYNVRFPNVNASVPQNNDPIFEVGNGYFDGLQEIYSNALTVFRNGNTTIDGNLIVNGNIASTSDERLKSNIEPFLRSDDVVMALEPVSYTLDNDEEQKTQIGFIAQDVEEVLPEVINHSFLLDDYKSVDYSKLTVVLVGAIQTLKNENQLLKEALCELNNKAEICL